MSENQREQLLAMFEAGLHAVHGQHRVKGYLSRHNLTGPVWVVAIGKAAGAMAAGASEVLGSQLRAGLLITKTGYGSVQAMQLQGFSCLEAGHPLPDQHSLEAGESLLRFMQAAPTDAQFLFLLSGGASSLVEVLPQGMELTDLQRANAWLLGSGLPIQAINQIRKRFSCIKGGRLIQHLHDRVTRVLVISDVIGDQLEDIGSGLLVPDMDSQSLPAKLPDWLLRFIKRAASIPATHDARFDCITTTIIARLQDAMEAVAKSAVEFGYEVRRNEVLLQGDALVTGRGLAAEILNGVPGVRVWGGETTVSLPEKPGRGGRNQSLALAAAMELSGHTGVWLLSAGTDGTDGPTGEAGALVDGGTVSRGETKGFQSANCLASADAGTFLQASGDLISTGTTGTNVMDLVIGLKL